MPTGPSMAARWTASNRTTRARSSIGLHAAHGNYDGIVYNPGAHTHYSYALHDAVECIDVPVVEIHISDISKREEFRRTSVIAPACIAQVKGLGKEGYLRALDILLEGE